MKHTGNSYVGKTQKYATMVDESPYNAYYERPSLISLLPPLANLTVLDVGCGNGWYAEYLLSQGAQVTAIDLNQEFVEMTQKRVGHQATVLQADLAEPLTFAENETFDLIICPLVMHYLKEWLPTFHEFNRVLKAKGLLLFSTHHPFMDWQLFELESYFQVKMIEDEWSIGTMRFYRRPLTLISQNLDEAGFCIERIVEPQPTEEFRQVNPSGFAKVSKKPWFLIIRARKKG